MSRRQDTCIRKECPFWHRYGDKCPNYVQGTWLTPEKHEYTTRDCAPKRSMILQQQIYDFMISTRKDYAETRRAMAEVLQLTARASGGDLVIIEGQVEDAKQIEDLTDGKDTD